ncbi:response regulator transcription factor [Aliikangiella coralliicola]|uniref:Response regulator transcription factor n=1 Tax=Aliikangiella coralliicola TaxID=2592383 RepID=A0A545UEP2_9GAMM|nr:response regulator transcription factor [Aliikangiella coralliicola]TQV87905.1 response regulator transcription factor [Aliikangiella coralliicola]
MIGKTIRVMIAEDQTMLLGALAALLDLEEDISVVYQASNGEQALNFLADESKDNVDILVTDIEMPEMTGLELAEQIKRKQLSVNTIILTTFSRAGYLRRAMDLGVKGYLLKDSPSDELILAIRKIAAGGKVIAPELLQEAWIEKDPLTDKERQALRLAKEGDTTEQIAERLHLSAGTVRNYLSSAANKLDAKNRVEAARIAHQNGWL